ncbi:MAG: DNA double-strand break repair nuclease NurA [Candidatus Diapherotrites archaeon]|nr:DNA double-strand break repair nuclease NurA [Candidatus Diapherotrites archaeon]
MPPKDFISQAAESILKAEEKRQKLVQKIRPFVKTKMNPLEMMVEKAECAELNGRLGAVDSGFVGQDFLSLDLVLIRARGVVFDYKKGKLAKAAYHPNYYSFPEPLISNRALQIEDVSTNKSLQRLAKEIGLAEEIIGKFSPDYCFLDGSIVPQHADKPRSNSKMQPFYKEVIEKFESLFSKAEEKNCTIIGCVEDSRGTRFKDIAEKIIGKKEFEELNECFDVVLLDSLLAEGERSFAFPYAENVKEHPVLQDFSKGFAEMVHAFYIKPSALDRPLRTEFLLKKSQGKQEIDRIASIVFAQSRLHREYSYPAVLIEADLRSRLREEEIKIICDKIFDRIGGSKRLSLRREKRPF